MFRPYYNARVRTCGLKLSGLKSPKRFVSSTEKSSLPKTLLVRLKTPIYMLILLSWCLFSGVTFRFLLPPHRDVAHIMEVDPAVNSLA